MKIVLAICLLLSSCTHVAATNGDDDLKNLQAKVDNLEFQLDFMGYENVNVRCFDFLDTCYLKARNYCEDKTKSCKGSGCSDQLTKCTKQTQDQCFKKHEQCIIDNYKKWLDIKKRKGYK